MPDEAGGAAAVEEPANTGPVTILPRHGVNSRSAHQERPAECAQIGPSWYDSGINAAYPDVGRATREHRGAPGQPQAHDVLVHDPVAHSLRNHGPEGLVCAAKTKTILIDPRGDKLPSSAPPPGRGRVG